MSYISSIIALCVLVCPVVFADDAVEFRLSVKEGERLDMYLINISDDSINLHATFSMALSDFGGVEFRIRKGETVYPLAVFLDDLYRPVTEKDVIRLEHHEIVGYSYSYSDIVRRYRLDPGIYEVEAVYKNIYGSDFDVLQLTLKSNVVLLEVK